MCPADQPDAVEVSGETEATEAAKIISAMAKRAALQNRLQAIANEAKDTLNTQRTAFTTLCNDPNITEQELETKIQEILFNVNKFFFTFKDRFESEYKKEHVDESKQLSKHPFYNSVYTAKKKLIRDIKTFLTRLNAQAAVAAPKTPSQKKPACKRKLGPSATTGKPPKKRHIKPNGARQSSLESYEQCIAKIKDRNEARLKLLSGSIDATPSTKHPNKRIGIINVKISSAVEEVLRSRKMYSADDLHAIYLHVTKEKIQADLDGIFEKIVGEMDALRPGATKNVSAFFQTSKNEPGNHAYQPPDLPPSPTPLFP